MNYVKKMVRGVTMLEMLLVLSVIAVLLILATRYYMSTSYSQKVSQLQAEINSLVAAAANYKTIDPTFANAPAANIIHTLYTSGYLSKADLDAATQTNALTPWSQLITMAYAAGTITITYPAAATGSAADNACHALASAITANSSSSAAAATCTSGFSYSFAP